MVGEGGSVDEELESDAQLLACDVAQSEEEVR